MYQFTSESVSEGHPDKVADLISDRVADFLLKGDITNRAAIETLVTTNMVTIAGEHKSWGLEKDYKDIIENIIRDTVKEIGYEQSGFDWRKLKIYNELHAQSPDIALGTDDFGAGDQGIMFGYANTETENFMPLAIYYAHEVLKELSKRRKTVEKYKNAILPDSKCQITVNYADKNTPIDINTVVVSTQHTEETSQDTVKELVFDVINDVIPKDLLTEKTKYHINPTGRFVIGGPDGDTGLTGRKIIVDTYGGYAPHGGGAFSGKDPTKVDRSAAYMARWIAKNIVKKYKFNDCFVQLSYVIGVQDPSSIVIYADGDLRLDMIDEIKQAVDLTPLGIIHKFGMFDLKLSDFTNYGHFGKDAPWEEETL